MYIPEGCTGFETTVLLSATSTHDGHVLYQRKRLAMMWVAGDLCVILYHISGDNDVSSWQMHSKLMSIEINSCLHAVWTPSVQPEDAQADSLLRNY